MFELEKSFEVAKLNRSRCLIDNPASTRDDMNALDKLVSDASDLYFKLKTSLQRDHSLNKKMDKLYIKRLRLKRNVQRLSSYFMNAFEITILPDYKYAGTLATLPKRIKGTFQDMGHAQIQSLREECVGDVEC